MGASASKQLPPGFEELGGLDLNVLREYKHVFENGGMSTLKNKVDEDINMWKKVPVNIAITGNSGVGKSSFINTFRGLKPGQEGAAPVGIDETTMEPTKYIHPDNENIALWDLPGIGTPKFPKERYLEQVHFQNYDYFLIITATRFTENDLWLAKEVRRLNKKFFFIRTKLGFDVITDKYDNPSVSKEDTVKKVRKAMKSHAENGDLQGVQVYLIDNHSYRDFDFPVLTEEMIHSMPKLKQDAMTFTLTTLTEQLIQRKKRAMLERIMIVSLGSAAAGAIPLPGLGLFVDAGIIMKECLLYRKQFGLDDESLQKNAHLLGIPTKDLLSKISETYILGTTVSSLSIVLAELTLSETIESTASIVLPIIGSTLAAAISYHSTAAVLKCILDRFVVDALKIHHLLMERLSASITH